MKSIFRGYFTLTTREKENIWNEGFIACDANVLLNTYRYSEDTRKQLFEAFKAYKNQLWLPYHAGLEFHNNRIQVIAEQIKIHTDTKISLEKLEGDIITNSRSPHLSKATQTILQKALSEVKKDLDKSIKRYEKLLENDTNLSLIASTFVNIGSPPTTTETSKTDKEADDRFKRKIPPGYLDNSKKTNKFGDYYIWRELIERAKSEKKPFIYITDDGKEDWWSKINGKTLHPRPELLQELHTESGQVFTLYTSDRFLKYALRSEDIEPIVFTEIREARTSRMPEIPYSLVQHYFNNSSFEAIQSHAEKIQELIKRQNPFLHRSFGENAPASIIEPPITKNTEDEPQIESD